MGVKKYLEAGKIVSVFGIKGEIKVQPWCDGPEFLCGFDTLYYKSGTPVEIERSRVAKNIVVMKVKGVDTVEEAQKLRNRVLYIDRDDVELDEGCYFVQDLIGLALTMFTTSLTKRGTLSLSLRYLKLWLKLISRVA